MTNFLDTLANYLLDGSKKLTSKIGLTIVAVLLVLLIDNIFSFSFFYRTNGKMEVLSKVENLLKDTSYSQESKSYLNNLRNQIVTREPLHIYFLRSLQNMSFTNSNNTITNNITNANPIFGVYYRFFYSSWLILIFSILGPITLLFKRKTSLYIKLFAGLLWFIIGFFYSYGIYVILNYLPTFKMEFANIIFAAFVQLIFLFLFIATLKKMDLQPHV